MCFFCVVVVVVVKGRLGSERERVSMNVERYTIKNDSRDMSMRRK